MLIRLRSQAGSFDLVPPGYTVSAGERLTFHDTASAGQFLNQFRHDPQAMAQLRALYEHTCQCGIVRRSLDDGALINALSQTLTNGTISVVQLEESSQHYRGTPAAATLAKDVEPKPQPITPTARRRWAEAFETEPVTEQKYKIVIEVAGKQLTPLAGHLDLRRTPEADDHGHQVRFTRDSGNDPHRVQLCFDNVPNKPRQLFYSIGTNHLPLYEDVTPVARETEAQQWANVLIPLIPVCCDHTPGNDNAESNAKTSVLPPGWLYVYLNGFLWRELQVCNHAGGMRDVKLSAHSGKHQRPADGQLSSLLLVPHKLNGATQTVQLAYARQQWNWTQVCNAGGINPADPRFLPALKQHSANTPVDAAFQNTQLKTLALSCYAQGFEAITENPAQGTTISPVAKAPEIIINSTPMRATDRLTEFRHLNIPVVSLPIAPTEPLAIAYLEANGQQGIQTHYCVTCQGGMRYEGELDQHGQAVIHNIAQGPVSIDFGEPTELEQLQQQRDQLRRQLKDTLSAMVSEVEARAYYQNRQLEQEGLINTGLIYTGAFLTGLYQSSKDLINSVTDLVVVTGGVILQIQLANHRAMNALMQGDVEQAKQAYQPLKIKGEAAINATEDSFETLSLLLGDAKTRELLMNFPKRYLGAHTSVEQTRMAGTLALDILLVLAGAIAGGALIAIKSSKYFTNATQLFNKLATTLKAIKLKKTVRGHTDQKRIEARAEEEKITATGEEYGYDVGGGVTKSANFKNLRPNDPILTPSTDTIANIQKTTQSGRFNYVVTQDGKLVLGRSGQSRPNGHINLAQGQDVLAAGEAKFVNGRLRYIDNFSGHYQPSGKAAQNAALQAFERAGVKPSQGYIERKF